MAPSKFKIPKLNTLANLAEIISTIAVVISLIYVSHQINQNTTAIKSATTQSVHDNFASWYSSVQGDPKLLEISIKGMKNYFSLAENEKAQFIAMFMTFASYSQNAFYKWKEGSLSQELWKSWEYILMNFVSTPGGKGFWEERGYLFGNTFSNYVQNDLMLRKPHPKAKSFGAFKIDSLIENDTQK